MKPDNRRTRNAGRHIRYFNLTTGRVRWRESEDNQDPSRESPWTTLVSRESLGETGPDGPSQYIRSDLCNPADQWQAERSIRRPWGRLADNIYVLITLHAIQAAGGAGFTPSATGS